MNGKGSPFYEWQKRAGTLGVARAYDVEVVIKSFDSKDYHVGRDGMSYGQFKEFVNNLEKTNRNVMGKEAELDADREDDGDV